MKVEFLEADMHYIHGVIAVVAPRGFGMMLDPTDATLSKLIPATAVQGFQLERDAVDVTSADGQNARLLEATLPADFSKPYAVGATVSARRATRMELEGADVLLTSGTGPLSSSTQANVALGYASGKLRVKQTNDEIAFIVRAQLTPEDPANFRLLVERP
jgi:hypothetical protein